MQKSVLAAVLLFFSLSLFWGSTGSSVCGSVLHVGGVGEGNFSSISDAVGIAVSNDTILIHPGLYEESFVIEQSYISLVGLDAKSTVIDAKELGCPVVLKGNYCVVSNLSLTNSTLWFPYAGLQVFGKKNLVRDCLLFSNYYGITLLKPSCCNRFVNLSLLNNKQCGAYLSGSCSNSFSSIVVSNHSFNGFGIYDLSNDNVVSECFFSLSGNCGVNIRDSDGTVLKDNVMVNNSIGLHVPPLPYKTTFIDNEISSNSIDVELQQTSFAASAIACVVLVFAAFIFFEVLFFRRS